MKKILVKKFTHLDDKYTGLFIHFPREEAICLCHSLLGQIAHNQPDFGRREYITQDLDPKSMKGLGYLTICVDPIDKQV